MTPICRRVFLQATAGAALAKQAKPNILIIMCDQLNATVISPYGGPVATPNLDRLARRGVLFTEATCTTPFCSPSRASLITGLYPHAHGIVYNVNRIDYPAIGGPATEQGIRTTDVTMEKILSASGYSTHQYGKWHLAGDALPYYTDQYGEHHEYAREMAATFREVRQMPRDEWMDWYGWALPVSVDPVYRKALAAEPFPEGRHAEFIEKAGRLELPLKQVFDVRVADRTVERLRSAGRGPFMITCSFNMPHDPNVAPSPYYEAFPPGKISLPANSRARAPRFEQDWSRQIAGSRGGERLRELLRIYYASVRLVDDQVGRVLDALEATGGADDTIIVFTADHGDMAGGHGMFWKSTSSFYDEVARVPLIISYPRRIRPGKSDAAASLVDISPTLLELTGHPVPSDVQGRSLLPVLLGNTGGSEAHPFSFCERVTPGKERTRTVRPGTPGSFMIRGGGWKYFRYPDGEEFLYNLRKDPGETINLAGERSHRSQQQELARELEAWLERTEYPGGRPIS